MIVAAVVTAAQEFMANEWPSWTKHRPQRVVWSSKVLSLRGKTLLRLRGGKVTDVLAIHPTYPYQRGRSRTREAGERRA